MTEAAVCGVIILFRQMSWGSSLLYLHGWAAERSLEIQDRYLSDCAFDAARRAKYQSLHRPPEFQSGSAISIVATPNRIKKSCRDLV